MINEREREEQTQTVEDLHKQIQIEGQLVGLYEEYENTIENKAMKRIMQMFRLDIQRHINILQAAIEIINEEELYIEDRKPLAASLKRHLELEAEALKNANKLLSISWISDNQGLRNLLEMWRDDERRHHAALKKITDRPYFRLTSNDMVAIFREEDFLEERYKRAKEYREKKEKNT